MNLKIRGDLFLIHLFREMEQNDLALVDGHHVDLHVGQVPDLQIQTHLDPFNQHGHLAAKTTDSGRPAFAELDIVIAESGPNPIANGIAVNQTNLGAFSGTCKCALHRRRLSLGAYALGAFRRTH